MTDKTVTPDDLAEKIVTMLDDHGDMGIHAHLTAAVMVVAIVVGSIDCKGCRAKAAQDVKKNLSAMFKTAMERPSSGDNHIH
jgi:hypothetical protein